MKKRQSQLELPLQPTVKIPVRPWRISRWAAQTIRLIDAGSVPAFQPIAIAESIESRRRGLHAANEAQARSRRIR